MKIVSTNGATVLNVDGVEYVADSGGFDVPQDLGERLVKGPAFERDYVALDKASAAEKAAAVSRDGILSRIEALEAAVFPDRAPEPTPVPASPALEPVPAAPEAPVEAEPVVAEVTVSENTSEDHSESSTDPANEDGVPVQSDAAPVDVPPIAEPDAPVDIPVENVPGEVVNEDGSPSTDLTPAVVSDEEAAAAEPAIVDEVPVVDPAAE